MSTNLSSVSGSSSSSSTIALLVAQYMSLEQQPLNTLNAKSAQLTTLSSTFTTLKSMLNDVKSAADALTGASGTPFISQTVTSSDSTIATGTASTSAAAGTYNLSNIVLATANQLQSAQVATSWTASGAGSFVLNGTLINVASGASLTDVMNAINNASYASGKGVSATVINVDSSNSRLVLTGQSTGAANTINLADVTGSTLSSLGITTGSTATALTGVTATASSEDPSYPATNLTDGVTGDANSWHAAAGSTTATVTLNLGSSQTIDRLEWGRDQGGTITSGTPSNYTLEYSNDGGTTWNTLKTVSGLNLAAGGTQDDTFAPVTANMIRMDINGTNDGTAPAIDEMKLYNDTSTLASGATLQAAGDASFTVNNVSISQQPSNNVTSAVSGLTINLAKAGGPVTLTVAPDTSTMTSKIQTFLDKMNALTDYLASNSQATKGSDGNYNWGPLQGYSLYTSLPSTLASDLSSWVSGVQQGAPAGLSDLGITMDSSLHFSITDSTTLNNLLATNPNGVAAVFGGTSGLAAQVSNALAPYVVVPTNGTQDFIDQELSSISDQQASIATQTQSVNDRLAILQKTYTDQLTLLQAAYLQAQQQQQELNSILSAISSSTSSS